MKHLGDISKVRGDEIEPVDIITFGSPCQDLSVAGKRAGLKHEDNGDDETTRSGLFMEAVRIIKEMRNATNGQYPRFAVWENVPGAFSSNNGEDFRIVLQELIKITEPYAVMPEVPKNGWAYADSYYGDGWSIAYRVFDAQYWGVPQRRRRIYLVADFRGGCAEKILFEREGLRGYFTESRKKGQTVANDAERSLGADDSEGECIIYSRGYGGNIKFDGASPTLEARAGTGGNNQPIVAYDAQHRFKPYIYDARGNGDGKTSSNLLCRDECSVGDYSNLVCFNPIGTDPYNGEITGDKSATLGVNCGMSTGCNGVIVEGLDAYNQTLTGDKAKTLNSAASDADHVPCTVYSTEERADPLICMATQQGGAEIAENLCPTITAAAGMSGNNQPVVAYGLDRASFNQGENAKFDFSILDDQQPTLTARGPGAVSYSFDPGASRDVGVLFIEEVGKTLTNGTCPGHHDGVVISRPIHSMTTGEYMQVNEEKTATLLARDYKDPTCVEVYDEKSRTYIVRRLTPTECARLQGFPDKWGHLEPKTTFSEDEVEFWREVRKTHDNINGRAIKDYNEKQMLTWYNKLWTDSAEYKMWGNGIALPCALYVLQGIKDALDAEQTARSKWLDELLNF